MARAAIVVIVLAILVNAGCFGTCAINACAQPSTSCHQHQKKSMEPCGHHLLFAENTVLTDGNPLIAAMPVISVTRPVPGNEPLSRQSFAPLPPLLSSSITILKI